MRVVEDTGRNKILAVAGSWRLAPAMQPRLDAMVPFFEDDEDPKKPRPVETQKKRTGWMERGETRKDHDRDGHRHVHVRC